MSDTSSSSVSSGTSSLGSSSAAPPSSPTVVVVESKRKRHWFRTILVVAGGIVLGFVVLGLLLAWRVRRMLKCNSNKYCETLAQQVSQNTGTPVTGKCHKGYCKFTPVSDVPLACDGTPGSCPPGQTCTNGVCVAA